MNKDFDTINHTLVLGSSGTGKTMRVVLPYVLSAIKSNENIVVTDGKNKLLNKVYNKLKEKNYEIVTVNMRDPQNSHAWNPLYLPYQYYLNDDLDTCIELLDDLGKNIMMDRLPGESTDPFWATSSKNMFVGLAIALFEDPETKQDMINLRSIYYMSLKGFERFGGSTFIHQYFKHKPIESRALEYMSSVLNAPNETRGSILSVFYQKLLSFVSKTSFWDKLCENEIDIFHLCSAKTAVFLIFEDEKSESSAFINIFLRQLYEAYIKNSNNIDYKPDFIHCHFILDDFLSLMPFYNLPNILMAARERNVSFLFSVNSMSLMEKIYGEELTDFISDNCANWVIFRNSEVKFIKKIKEYIELFFGQEAFLTYVQNANFTEPGMALFINLYKGIQNHALKIPDFVEETYIKRKNSPNTSYSIYKIEENVRKRMQEELIEKMKQDPTDKNNASPSIENQFTNSKGEKPDQMDFDVDELIKKIDEKIAELEQEERKTASNGKKTGETHFEEARSAESGDVKTSAETADISLEEPVDDIGEIKKFGLYDADEKRIVHMDTLFTFDDEESGEKYIAYTDNSKNKTGNVNVYAGILKKRGEKVQLNPIEDEKMFDRIEIILNELQKEVRKNNRNE